MAEQRRDNHGMRQGKAAKLQAERADEPILLGLVCVGASDLLASYSTDDSGDE